MVIAYWVGLAPSHAADQTNCANLSRLPVRTRRNPMTAPAD